MNGEIRGPSRLQPDWIVAIVITLAILGFHLRFYAHAGGLWRDEVNSVNVAARHSVAGMADDSFPVLTPLLLHGWMIPGPGKSDQGLRALGLLIGLAIPAVFWIAAWKLRRRPPLISLVLFALNGTLIVFGDSLRPYGLGCLTIAAAAAAACLHLRRPDRARAALFGAFAVLSVQTLFHNAVLIAAICLGSWAVLLRKRQWQGALQVLAIAALAAISLLPYAHRLVSIHQQVGAAQAGTESLRLRAVFADALGFPFGFFVYVWLAIFLVVLIRTVVAGRKPSADDSFSEDLSMFTAVAVPSAFVGFYLFLQSAGMASQLWYLLPLLAMAALCLDVAWPGLPRIPGAVFLCLVAAAAWFAIPVADGQTNNRLTNMDLQARQLVQETARQDYVIVVPWYCGISFQRYFQSAVSWDTAPPLADHSIHRPDLVRLQMQNTNALGPVMQKMEATLRGGGRVWVVAEAGFMDIPEPGTMAPATLPPAPLPATGWYEVPYQLVWASQVGHYLGDHSERFARVAGPATGVLVAVERVELFVANGWKPMAVQP